MTTQEKNVTEKSKRGRPAGINKLTHPVRLPVRTIELVDRWIGEQPEPLSRPDAVAALVRKALGQSV